MEQENVNKEENPFEPQPIAEQPDGKKLYLIEDYRIWAMSYQQALEFLPLIKSF